MTTRKDDFLATLAHELRNPLAPIRSTVQDRRRALDAGFDEHLTKPVELETLQPLLHSLSAAA